MKEQFLNNINSIFEYKNIEGIPLQRIDILKDIISDENLFDIIYSRFSKYFDDYFDEDDLSVKTEDLMYRLNYLINNWMIPIHHIDNIEDIKSTLNSLIEKDIDLYGAVSFNDSDIELLDEFEELFYTKDHSI